MITLRQLRWRDLERLTHSNDELWAVSFMEQHEAMWLICDQQQPIINVSDWTADITEIRDECIQRTESVSDVSETKDSFFLAPPQIPVQHILHYVKVFLPPDISDPHRFFCAFCFVALKHISTWLFSLTGHFGNICSLLSPVVKEVFWPLTKVKDITIWNKQKKLQ